VASYLGGMRSGANLRPSNLLSVSGSSLARLTLCFYTSMVEAKRAHPIYQRVFAQGRSRARAAVYFFKRLLLLE
jgi:hypothetical protein